MEQQKKSSLWVTLPSVQYRRDPYFYFKYDLFYVLFFSVAIAAMLAVGWKGLQLSWNAWLLVPLSIGIYIQVMGGVLIHNCSHVNFPRPINRLVGEICGVIVATRFASWEILHRRHHRHSDDIEKDPHPVKPSFLAFLLDVMVLNLEKNLHQQYAELYGDTPEIRRRETIRSILSFSTMLFLMAFWFVLLGPVGFLGVYLPALGVGILHVSHFNWATHDAQNPSGEFKPVNLNHGFYWFGNKLWFGLYFHANHHEHANLFNPAYLDRYLEERDRKVREREERLAGAAAMLTETPSEPQASK
ncbi:MAG: fatty acid desaturase [Myxococcales bacterium]|nr:fatty acid desaturase [Myxococcales bacterium]